MNLTLLLDLDDTLLENNIDDFLPHYLQSFARVVAPSVDPDHFVKCLLAATRVMTANRQPDCTLQEVFDAAFFPMLGVYRQQFEPLAEHFYANLFPQLKNLTRPKTNAVEIVAQAIDRDYRIGIATNPLFPRTAIQQRLEWANLPPHQYTFDLVPSYETFHFAKPDPCFYAEFLGQMGWPSETILMVGDSIELDIQPAQILGLATYWVHSDQRASLPATPQLAGDGEIGALLEWTDRQSPEALKASFNAPAASLAVLRSTPAVLDSLSRNLSPEVWSLAPQAGEWSPTEIICHLRDVEQEVNLLRIKKLLQEDNPFLAGQDTDRWAIERQYLLQNGRQALKDFTLARLQLLSLLEALDSQGWQRSARHAIFGPTLLSELVNIISSHDRLHLQQFFHAIHAH